MAIRGDAQIEAGSIFSEQLNVAAGIQLEQLARGLDIILRDGSVAMAENLDMGKKALINLAAVTDESPDQYAATVKYVKDKFATIISPIQYKSTIDATAGVLPSDVRKGWLYLVTGEGIFGDKLLSAGDMIVANTNVTGATTIADFDEVDNQQYVTAVAGKTGNVVLEIADIVGLVAALATLQTNIDTVQTNVNTLTQKVADNKTAIEATVAANKTAIETALAAEVTRATGAEGNLTTLTTTAKTNLVAAINELDADLAAEVTRATAAEAALDTRIDSLESNVSGNVADAIAAEAAARAAADGDLTTLTTTAKGSLVAAINELDADLASEVTRATAAEAAVQAALNAYKTSNDAALAAEVTRATAAEGTVQSNLDAAVTTLNASIATKQGIINFADDDLLVGTKDGVNKVFTLTNVPVGGLQIFRNGVLLIKPGEYTVAGSTVTFGANVTAPKAGEDLRAFYRY